MLKMMFLIIMVTFNIGTSLLDCEYEVGQRYRYDLHIKAEISLSDLHGSNNRKSDLQVSANVYLTPLKGPPTSFLIQVNVEDVHEHGLDTTDYLLSVGYTTFHGVFHPNISKLYLPPSQSYQGSNIVRSVVSMLSIHSCVRSGIYSITEDTILGRHTTEYTANNVIQARFDDIRNHGRGDGETTKPGLEVTRRVVKLEQPLDLENRVLGLTSRRQKEFIWGAVNQGSTHEYTCVIGSKHRLVTDCIAYEHIAPHHLPFYSSSTSVAVRSSLVMVGFHADDLELSTRTLSQLGQLLAEEPFQAASLEMELVKKPIKHSDSFVKKADRMKKLLEKGYESTSIEVIKLWIDLVRELNIGVDIAEIKRVLDDKMPLKTLALLMDVANTNGTAQLHAQVHQAMRRGRALSLTDRFIATKQFTPLPALRMLKWLLRTCNVERFHKSCVVALSSSATNYWLSNREKQFIVDDSLSYLFKQYNTVSTEEDKVFYITVLANVKLPKATKFLLETALNGTTAMMRKAAIDSLYYHDKNAISYEDRFSILRRVFEEGATYGATALHFVLTTAQPENIASYIQISVETICSTSRHPLSTFLRNIISTLMEKPGTAKIVRATVSKLYERCQYCLPGEGEVNRTPETLATSTIFGNKQTGLRLETLFIPRVSKTSVSLGKTSVVMETLKSYGLPSTIVHSEVIAGKRSKGNMFDKLNDSRGGDYRTWGDIRVNVGINNQLIRSHTFQDTEKEQRLSSNTLLSDVTLQLSTVSGLPLSYFVSGSQHVVITLGNTSNPHLLVHHDVGYLTTSGFSFNGNLRQWITESYLRLRYQDKYSLQTYNLLRKDTTINQVRYHVTTNRQDYWSTTPDLVRYGTSKQLNPVNFKAYFDKNIPANLPNCQIAPTKTLLSIKKTTSITKYVRRSHLDSWLEENYLLFADDTNLYEYHDYRCSKSSIFKQIIVTNFMPHHTYNLQIQSLNGVILAPSHSGVQVEGPRRFLQLRGSVADILAVLNDCKYYPLPHYFGPDMIIITLKNTNVSDFTTAQFQLVLFITEQCS